MLRNFQFYSACANLRFVHKLDVAIIGGGCFGASLAYHLTKIKPDINCSLFEKTELTAGSTWHAAGLITYFNPGINMKKIHYDSLKCYDYMFENFEDPSVISAYHKPHSIRIATTKERYNEMLYQMNRYYSCVLATKALTKPNQEIWIDDSIIKQRLISVDEIHKMCPIINTENIYAGLLTENDGHIDPNTLTQLFVSYAKKQSPETFSLHTNSQLEYVMFDKVDQKLDGYNWRLGIKTTDAKNSGSELFDREYVTKHIVNCAGLWASEVNALFGINNTPLVPICHQYLITDSSDELSQILKQDNLTEIAVMRDLENSYYLRQEKNCLLIGPYESSKSMHVLDKWINQGVPKNFGRELFEPDTERLMPHLTLAMDRFPILRELGIKVCVHGPIMYSPDVLPLVGPLTHPKGGRGLWIAAGSGYGIVHAGGMGKYLAQWILNGEPPYDLIECDSERYNWASKDFVFVKARESYGMNNAKSVPKEQRYHGRPFVTRSTSLAGYLNARGAVMGFSNGWETPLYFNTAYDHQNIIPFPNESYGIANKFKPSYYAQPDIHDACVRQEYLAVKECIGLFDLTPFAKYYLSLKKKGLVQTKEEHCDILSNNLHTSSSTIDKDLSPPDVLTKFLNETLANRVPKLGETVISHIIGPQSGNVYGELTVSQVKPNEYLLLSGSGSEFHDFRWLQHSISNSPNYAENIMLQNVTESFHCISFAGKLAPHLMEKLLRHVKVNPMQAQNLSSLNQHMQNRIISFPKSVGTYEIKHPVIALNISYTGEYGWELYSGCVDSLNLYRLLEELGAEFGIKSAGSFAMNSLRIEKGFRAWSHEMNMDSNPYQAGLGMFIRLDKEDTNFNGASNLTKIKKNFIESNTPDKVLCYFTIENNSTMQNISKQSTHLLNHEPIGIDAIDLDGNESLWFDNECLGFTTSGAYSWDLGRHVALGYISKELKTRLLQTNSPLQILYMGQTFDCKIHKSPLIKTAHQREKSIGRTENNYTNVTKFERKQKI